MNVLNYTDNTLLSIQIQKLKNMRKQNPNLEYINNLFKDVKKCDINEKQHQQDMNNQTTEKVLVEVLKILNSAFFSNEQGIKAQHLVKNGKKYGYKEGSNAQTIYEDISKSAEELDNLLKLIISNENERKKIVNSFRVGAGQRGYTKKILTSQGYKTYKQYKADLVEQLVKEALAKDSKLKFLVTGGFTAGKEGQQLIEDVMVFDPKSDNLNKKLLKDIDDKLSGNVKIKLEDELYDQLRKVSKIKIQVKSGFGDQDILNQTKYRNALSYNQLQKNELLRELENNNADENYVKALSNYCLSLSIAQTSLKDNDIYFTKDGFITADEWMKKYKKLLKFNNYTIGNNYMSVLRPYQFYSIK